MFVGVPGSVIGHEGQWQLPLLKSCNRCGEITRDNYYATNVRKMSICEPDYSSGPSDIHSSSVSNSESACTRECCLSELLSRRHRGKECCNYSPVMSRLRCRISFCLIGTLLCPRGSRLTYRRHHDSTEPCC